MTQLGKYDILEELGRGSFGTVYKARDTGLDKLVALKVLHPQLMVDARFIENFKREAQNMAKIFHPNVVTVYEIAEVDNRLFIAMRYLPGGSLADRLKKEGPLSMEKALKVIREVSIGLEAGHKRGVIHRDVKPENILFDEEGLAVVADFGLAKVMQASSTTIASSYGGTVGTPSYRAPELWNGSPPPSPATDVYSLACMFYEMLTGEVLFKGAPAQLITKHLLEKPKSIIDRCQGQFPVSIQPVIEKALAKDPEERIRKVTAFCEDLEQQLEAIDSEKTNLQKMIIPLWALWIVGILIIVIALVAGTNGLIRSRNNRSDVDQPTIASEDTFHHIIETPKIASLELSETVNKQTTATKELSTATPKATPVPEIIESGNPGVSIKVYNDTNITYGKGKIQIQIISGDKPLTDVSLCFLNAAIDISGVWSAPWTRGCGIIYKTNLNGIIEIEKDPGNYAIVNRDSSAVWNQLMGTWGVEVSGRQSLILPVNSGKRTEVLISLAKIEIGVIQNGNAVDDAFIDVYCLDEDIAGNIILVSCKSGNNYRRTNYTGTTSLNLGTGEYVLEIRLYNGFSTYFYSPKITVRSNDTRQEVYYLDQMQEYNSSIVK